MYRRRHTLICLTLTHSHAVSSKLLEEKTFFKLNGKCKTFSVLGTTPLTDSNNHRNKTCFCLTICKHIRMNGNAVSFAAYTVCSWLTVLPSVKASVCIHYAHSDSRVVIGNKSNVELCVILQMIT